MIYRLVTVYLDRENDGSPVMRSARDFPTEQAAEEHVAAGVAARVMRLEIGTEPMENGAHLKAVFVPIERVVAWYIWELPDNTPLRSDPWGDNAND